MPIFGELESASRAERCATITRLADDSDAFAAQDVDILTFTQEVDTTSAFTVIPKALHPSLPPYVQVIFRCHPDSRFGPMITAEVNVRARSTIHQVGYTVASFTDNANATAWLREQYGFPTQTAELTCEKRYTGVDARIDVHGESRFAGQLQSPHYISPTDVLFTPTLNLAHLDGELKLVQQELEYTLERAERGQPRIDTFDAAALGEPALRLANPLPATWVRAKEVKYENVRFLVDPEVPAMQSTTDLAKQAKTEAPV